MGYTRNCTWSEIRTRTECGLNALPLPLGYPGAVYGAGVEPALGGLSCRCLFRFGLPVLIAQSTGIEPASTGRQPASLTRCLRLQIVVRGRGLEPLSSVCRTEAQPLYQPRARAPVGSRTREPRFGGAVPIHRPGRARASVRNRTRHELLRRPLSLQARTHCTWGRGRTCDELVNSQPRCLFATHVRPIAESNRGVRRLQLRALPLGESARMDTGPPPVFQMVPARSAWIPMPRAWVASLGGQRRRGRESNPRATRTVRLANGCAKPACTSSPYRRSDLNRSRQPYGGRSHACAHRHS